MEARLDPRKRLRRSLVEFPMFQKVGLVHLAHLVQKS